MPREERQQREPPEGIIIFSSASANHAATSTTRATRSTWWRRLIAPVSLALISFAVVAIAVPQQHQLSPIDEYVYVDYVEKVSSQLVVRHGEETGEYARDQLACRGVLIFGQVSNGCGLAATQADSAYPLSGMSSADIYAPPYFLITRVLAQPFVWAGVDLTDAARLVGGLWLGLGVVLLYFLMVRLSVPKLLAWGVSLIVVSSPAAHWSSTYVSTDAPAIAVGAGLGLIATLVYQRRASPWWLVLAAVFGVLLKFQNIIAVALVAIILAALAIRELRNREAGTRRFTLLALLRHRLVVSAVAIVAASVVVQLGWMAVRAALTIGEPPKQGVDMPLTPTALFMQSFNFLFRAALGVEQGGATPVMSAAGILVVALGVTGVIGMIFVGRQGSVESLVAGSTLLASTIAAPVLSIVLVIAVGEYVDLPPRYGLSLLPAYMLCAAWVLSHKSWSPKVVAAGASVLVVASVLHS
jgi:hypothetical protein